MSLLSYVFWHRPRSRVSAKTYQGGLLAFFRSLNANPSEGFVDALSFKEEKAPWSGRRSVTYEDWYLVEDFRALGALNEVAVAGSNKRPHDEVAKDASAGWGGVYKLLSSDLRLRDSRHATWLSKPPGTSYHSFLDYLSEITAEVRSDVWQRQLVLSPAPEFCLHSEKPVRLPRKLGAMGVQVRPVSGRAA